MERKGISGSTIKIIAIVTMLIDHIGAAILARYIMISGYMEIVVSNDANVINQWLMENGTLYNIYQIMRMIGRVAFPIFCFLLVEGFLRTRDVKKYAIRLGAFALISEIPFNLALTSKVMEFQYQNVYFTLLIGLLMMAFDKIEKTEWIKPAKLLLCGVSLVAGAALAEFLRTDYGATGVICILVLYIFHNQKTLQIIAGCVSFLWETTAPFAFIPIAFYNGKRGLQLKYIFYIFYPLHLLILYLICVYLGIASTPAV